MNNYLTIYQRSLYLTVLNATMIARGIAKKFAITNRRRMLKKYKNLTFREMEKLSRKMEQGRITTGDIRKSIKKIFRQMDRISFGQAQKGLNVLLKVHWFLYHLNGRIAKELDCPLDSKVLKSLSIKDNLSEIDEATYKKIQERIQSHAEQTGEHRIDYDKLWDKQHLQEKGLLND